MADPESIKLRIAELQLEHRALDQMIARLSHAPSAAVSPAPPAANHDPVSTPESDDMQLRRMKKRKLRIKDSIVLLQMQLTPDVPA